MGVYLFCKNLWIALSLLSRQRSGNIRLQALKIALATLASAKLVEKYACKFLRPGLHRLGWVYIGFMVHLSLVMSMFAYWLRLTFNGLTLSLPWLFEHDRLSCLKLGHPGAATLKNSNLISLFLSDFFKVASESGSIVQRKKFGHFLYDFMQVRRISKHLTTKL